LDRLGRFIFRDIAECGRGAREQRAGSPHANHHIHIGRDESVWAHYGDGYSHSAVISWL